MKRRLLPIIFFVTVLSAMGQLNTAYFDRLKSEKVPVDDLVKWRQVGPGMAGYCEEFWCHPTNENVMFMAPDLGDFYGSWDNGVSWQTAKGRSENGDELRRVKSLAFSHQDADFGIALDVVGVYYHTTDQGQNWVPMGSLPGGRQSTIVVDPTDDNYWYVGGGDFWDVKNQGTRRTLASMNDPSKGYIYPWGGYGHIMKSSDRGKTWSRKTTGLPAGLDVAEIVVDPTNPSNIVIASNYGVYRSTDRGESWSPSATGLPNNRPRDMTYYYNAADDEFIIYLVEQTFFEASGSTTVSKGGVYKSIDHGASWVNMTGNLAIDLTSVNNYFVSENYYRALGIWFGISKNQAKDDYPILPNSALSTWNRLVVNPTNKDELYLSHNTKHDRGAFGVGDIWKTSDGGQSWVATARSGKYWISETDKSYWQARNNPIGANVKYAHLQHDQDEKFEIFGNRFLEINSVGEVFACLEQQVVRSNDQGATWNQMDDDETEEGSGAWIGRGDSNLPGRLMLLETGIKSRYFFCSGEHGLWESAPLGDWADRKDVAVKQIEGQNNEGGALSIATVAVHPNNPDIIYTLQFRQTHRGYFRRSTDGGKTWETLSRPVVHEGNNSSDMLFQYSLTIDHENPNNIYFTLISNAIAEVSAHLIPDDIDEFGVYKSTDGGLTWSTKNNGFPLDASVRRIAMDKDNGATLYAALNEGTKGGSGGLYKTTDGGENWSKMTIPAEIVAVNNIYQDRNNRWLYISCGRFEGSLKEGGVWRSKDEGSSWEKIFDMPYIWQTTTSPLNPDIITVSCAIQNAKKNFTMLLNTGAYLSKDGGETWHKINDNLGQPGVIVDFKPDPYIEGIYWLALKSSGWTVGYEEGVTEGWNDLIAKEEPSKVLDTDARVDNKKVGAYPNPTSNSLKVTLNFTDPEKLAMDVISVDGKSIPNLKWQRYGNMLDIDTSDLNPGIYLVLIKRQGKTYSIRFVRE
ncbi:VPS10 domain-containing protein [Marinoscillum furvescens]|nr:T9SS type A sorting domain-containing protein [Marinoscillum furvescens]